MSFSKPTSTTLEEILIQGQEVGATNTTDTTAQAHHVVEAAILISEGVEREPPAKKLKLTIDSFNGGETQKGGGESILVAYVKRTQTGACAPYTLLHP